MVSLTGCATGIGSLPFTEASRAVETVFKYLPRIPFWPQLPKRAPGEGMVAQYAGGMPCVSLDSGEVFFDDRRREEELEVFYDRIIREDVDAFALSRQSAEGLYCFRDELRRRVPARDEIRVIKGQVTGPLTFAASIKDEKGVALLHDEVLMQAIVQALVMKARWQQVFFQEFARPLLMFVDEPFMSAFGSAYTALTRERAVAVFAELTAQLKSRGMIVGVHCCGNTDWSIFTDMPTVDIINFDAFAFLDTFVLYAQSIAAFLQRGGYLCWGVVPTGEFTSGMDASYFEAMIHKGIALLAQKGVDETLLRERLLISPSCGLGTIEPDAASGILGVLAATAKRFDNI